MKNNNYYNDNTKIPKSLVSEFSRGELNEIQIMYEIHIYESHTMSPMYLSFIHRVSTDVLILRDLLEREATK